MTAIQPALENIRGLKFKRPVYAGVVSREAYAAETKESIAKWLQPVEENALSKEYAQMGLLPESGTPLSAILTTYWSGFPAAFYRTGTDSMYIIPDSDRDTSELDNTIAHELTHALQDQNFNIHPDIFPDYSKYNGDAEMARRSVIEGDALFTEFVYYYSNSSDKNQEYVDPYYSARNYALELKSAIINGTYPTEMPVFLDVQGIMPYFLGALYLANKYLLAESWEPVNALYSISDLPRSVADINNHTTNPVTYFDFHAIHAMLASSPGTIEYVDDDNGGFSLLHGMLYRNPALSTATESFFLRGDRYTFVKRTGQTYGTLVWAMAFSTTGTAGYLFKNLSQLISSRRLNGETAAVNTLPDSAAGRRTCTFTSPSITTTLIQAEDRIWWIENADTLTQPIRDLLEAQRTAPPPAKKTAGTFFPSSLPHEAKSAVLPKLLEYLMRQKG